MYWGVNDFGFMGQHIPNVPVILETRSNWRDNFSTLFDNLLSPGGA